MLCPLQLHLKMKLQKVFQCLSLHAQTMLILIDVQYLWNVVFSITKELDGQNNSLFILLPNVKSPPQQNF